MNFWQQAVSLAREATEEIKTFASEVAEDASRGMDVAKHHLADGMDTLAAEASTAWREVEGTIGGPTQQPIPEDPMRERETQLMAFQDMVVNIQQEAAQLMAVIQPLSAASSTPLLGSTGRFAPTPGCPLRRAVRQYVNAKNRLVAFAPPQLQRLNTLRTVLDRKLQQLQTASQDSTTRRAKYWAMQEAVGRFQKARQEWRDVRAADEFFEARLRQLQASAQAAKAEFVQSTAVFTTGVDSLMEQSDEFISGRLGELMVAHQAFADVYSGVGDQMRDACMEALTAPESDVEESPPQPQGPVLLVSEGNSEDSGAIVDSQDHAARMAGVGVGGAGSGGAVTPASASPAAKAPHTPSPSAVSSAENQFSPPSRSDEGSPGAPDDATKGAAKDDVPSPAAQAESGDSEQAGEVGAAADESPVDEAAKPATDAKAGTSTTVADSQGATLVAAEPVETGAVATAAGSAEAALEEVPLSD
mmetsp:Transcript_13971/g.30915  ORF Transcript_13971/g.30915 Transcript_13971/m.30915 type:complete len:474 (+) Transcript_13971:31-1452(+)